MEDEVILFDDGPKFCPKFWTKCVVGQLILLGGPVAVGLDGIY